MTPITAMCRTCAYSEPRASMLAAGWLLWCTRHQCVAQQACGEWMRATGADDE